MIIVRKKADEMNRSTVYELCDHENEEAKNTS